MIFKTPALVAGDLALATRIEESRVKLRSVMSAPKRWFGVLRRSTLARAIRGSNSIEGYLVTKDDALAAVEGEEPIDAQTETWAAVTGYQQAMTYVLQLANDPHFRYTADLIRSLHFMMLQYDLSKLPGRWRQGAIYVRDEDRDEVVYEGPPEETVPELVAEMVEALNDSQAPSLINGAMGHLNLVMIHPFKDGNGRMARCLQTLILAREGILDPRFCSIEEYLGRNTHPYYDILAYVGQGRWNPTNDAGPWVNFCLVAHFNQAATVLKRMKETERVWDELERMVSQLRLPDRAMYALSDATFGYRVRNATYRSVAEVSDQVASRDLKSLVDAGFLIAAGEKRGRCYLASPLLQNLRERTREPRILYTSPSWRIEDRGKR